MGSRKTSLARREFAACQDHWVFAGGKSRPVDIQPERGSASDITAPNAPQYDMAMQIVRFMKLRHRFGLAPRHDAAFNILLEMYISLCRRQQVTVGNACIASCIPSTSALRVIDMLIERGFVERDEDVSDHRRKLLRFSHTGISAMNCFFDALIQDGTQADSVSAFQP